jgi:hypothetical protein
MTYLSPKTILVDFLRKNVTDPRGRITSNSETLTATASQTDFTLTPTAGKTLSYITSVTVDAVSKTKWQDYYIDFKNQKVIFFTGLTAGQSVVITYGEGATDWIYPDKANVKLNALSFPRMNILVIGAPGTRLGNYEAPVEAVPRIQVDIWTKEKQDNQIFTIDGNKYTGEDLAEYLAYQVTQAFENNEEELFPALYGYDPVGMPPDLPFDDELQCHHKTVEFLCRGLSIGRIN